MRMGDTSKRNLKSQLEILTLLPCNVLNESRTVTDSGKQSQPETKIYYDFQEGKRWLTHLFNAPFREAWNTSVSPQYMQS